MIRRDAVGQDDRLRRREPAVNLDAQVHLVADRLAIPAHPVDGRVHLAGMRLEVGDVRRLVQEWREMPHRREAALLGVTTALHQLLGRLTEDVAIDSGLVAAAPAHQLVARHAKMLAGDIPQRDIDGAQCAHDGSAAKVAPSIQILPVVLDPQRILADEVAGELLDGLLRGFEVAPGA